MGAPQARITRPTSWSPSEGWLTLALVIVMCVALAWSFDDALLVLGEETFLDFLFWMAVGGVVVAFVGAKAGWGRWKTYLIGGTFGALLTPILVGAVLVGDTLNPGILFAATAESTVLAWRDLIVLDRLTTQEYGHHLLVLGLLVWASSMFASYAAFGHRRPINGVILIGVLLVGNMSLTRHDQLGYLVLYSVSALFILIRFHTFEERTEWLRRRIGDPAAISSMYLRGGTVFIVITVVGSILLTQTASSAPLAGMWTDVGSQVIDWSRGLERFLPASRDGVSFGPDFDSSAPIKGVWSTDDGLALTIELPTTEAAAPYWTAVVYDTFEGDGWRQSPVTSQRREAGSSVLDGTGDQLPQTGVRELRATVIPDRATRTVFVAAAPSTLDVPVDVDLVGADGYFAGVRRDPTDGPYTVTSLVPERGDEIDGGLTQNRLRAAGTDYPDEVEALYLQLPEDALGEAGLALADEVEATADDNPFDVADTVQHILQDPERFSYRPDVRGVNCRDISVAECFARERQGYCEYYATTMTVILRELGIPARFVEGFLPGTRDERSGIVTVRNRDAHAWVEVYFPGYGWVRFDPTGGGVAQTPPLPSGDPVSSARPRSSATVGPGGRFGPEDRDQAVGGGTTGSSGGGSGPFIAIGLLLALMVGGLAFVAWQRGPRGPVSADGVYASVTRLAARLGFGPRPNQTVYEYADALASVVPVARPELDTVARAKVETTYGQRVLGDERLIALRHAQRRLRLSLLRLAVRRVRRPRR